jgi:hypothetical protein
MIVSRKCTVTGFVAAALLHLPIGGRAPASADRSSDGGGELGERRGDAESARASRPSS